MGGTQGSLSAMSNQIQQTAIDTASSVSDVEEAVKTYSNASSTAQTALDKAKSAIELSNVTGLDATQTTDSIHAIISEYNLAGQNAETTSTNIANSLVNIGKNMSTDFGVGVESITQGIQIIGTVANTVGKQTNVQTEAMLGAIVEKTRQSGTVVANGLKTIMARVYASTSLDPTVTNADMSKMSSMLNQLGISVRGTTGAYKPFNDILQEIDAKEKNMTDSQKMAINTQAAGIRQSNIFANALSTVGTAQDLANKGTNSANALMSANSVYLDTTAAKSKVLSATFASMWMQMSPTAAIGGLVTGLTDIINTFGNLDTIIAVVTTAFLLFKGKAITQSIEDMADYVVSLGTTITETGLLGVVETALTGIQGLWNKAIMENPLGLLAIAVTGVIVGVDLFNNSQKESITDLGNVSSAVIQEQNSIDGLQSKLTTLDQLNSKIKLSNSEKSTLQNTNNALASEYPQLITHYNDETKAFTVSTTALKALIAQKEKNNMESNANNLANAESDAASAKQQADSAQAELDSGVKIDLSVKGVSTAVKLSTQDRNNLITTINKEEAAEVTCNQTINQATEFINDYTTSQKANGVSQTAINNALIARGYTQDEINKATLLGTSSTNTDTQALKAHGLSMIADTKTIEDQATALKNDNIKAFNQAMIDSNKTVDDAKTKISAINAVIADHTKNNTYDTAAIKKLAETYPNLLACIGNDSKMTKALNKDKQDETNTVTTELDKQIKANDDLVNMLAKDYNIDFKNKNISEIDKTNMLIAEVDKRIKAYEAEAEAMKAAAPPATAAETKANLDAVGNGGTFKLAAGQTAAQTAADESEPALLKDAEAQLSKLKSSESLFSQLTMANSSGIPDSGSTATSSPAAAATSSPTSAATSSPTSAATATPAAAETTAAETTAAAKKVTAAAKKVATAKTEAEKKATEAKKVATDAATLKQKRAAAAAAKATKDEDDLEKKAAAAAVKQANAVAAMNLKIAEDQLKVAQATTDKSKDAAQDTLNVDLAAQTALNKVGETAASIAQDKITAIQTETTAATGAAQAAATKLLATNIAASNALIAGYQAQIDAINAKTAAESLATQQLTYQNDLIQEQSDLTTANTEKNVKVMQANGLWQWEANATVVQTAQAALTATQTEVSQFNQTNSDTAKIASLNASITVQQNKQTALNAANTANPTGYATGTDDAAAGVANVNEDGTELLVGNKAKLQGGETIINAANTSAILSGGSPTASPTATPAPTPAPTVSSPSGVSSATTSPSTPTVSSSSSSATTTAVNSLIEESDAALKKFILASPEYGKDLDNDIGISIKTNDPLLMTPLATLLSDVDTSIQKFVDSSPLYAKTTEDNIGKSIKTNETLLMTPLDTLISDVDNDIQKFVDDSPEYAKDTENNIGQSIKTNESLLKIPLDTLIADINTDIEKFVIASPSYGLDTETNIGNSITKNDVLVTVPMNAVIAKVKAALDTFVTSMNPEGASIVTDLGDGITSKNATIVTLVNKLTKQIIGLFNTGFGIASPSKVMYQIGEVIAV
jgi:hypothetical protein